MKENECVSNRFICIHNDSNYKNGLAIINTYDNKTARTYKFKIQNNNLIEDPFIRNKCTKSVFVQIPYFKNKKFTRSHILINYKNFMRI